MGFGAGPRPGGTALPGRPHATQNTRPHTHTHAREPHARGRAANPFARAAEEYNAHVLTTLQLLTLQSVADAALDEAAGCLGDWALLEPSCRLRGLPRWAQVLKARGGGGGAEGGQGVARGAGPEGAWGGERGRGVLGAGPLGGTRIEAARAPGTRETHAHARTRTHAHAHAHAHAHTRTHARTHPFHPPPPPAQLNRLGRGLAVRRRLLPIS